MKPYLQLETLLSMPFEVQELIGIRIPPHDLTSCVRVSRAWYKLFVPFLWYKVRLETDRALRGSQELFWPSDDGRCGHDGGAVEGEVMLGQQQQGQGTLEDLTVRKRKLERIRYYFQFVRSFTTKFHGTLGCLLLEDTHACECGHNQDSHSGQASTLPLHHRHCYSLHPSLPPPPLGRNLVRLEYSGCYYYTPQHLSALKNLHRSVLVERNTYNAAAEVTTNAYEIREYQRRYDFRLEQELTSSFVAPLTKNQTRIVARRLRDKMQLAQTLIYLQELERVLERAQEEQDRQTIVEQRLLMRLLEVNAGGLQSLRLERFLFPIDGLVKRMVFGAEGNGFQALRSFHLGYTQTQKRFTLLKEEDFGLLLMALPEGLQELSFSSLLYRDPNAAVTGGTASTTASTAGGADQQPTSSKVASAASSLSDSIADLSLLLSERPKSSPRRRRLQKLVLQNCIMTRKSIKLAWDPYLQECPHLQSLDLQWNEMDDGADLGWSLRQHSPNLQELVLRSPGRWTTVEDVDTARWIRACGDGGGLKKLVTVHRDVFGPIALNRLMEHRMTLSSLAFLNAGRIPSTSLQVILSQCPNLQELRALKDHCNMARFAPLSARDIAVPSKKWVCGESLRVFAVAINSVPRLDIQVDHHGMPTLKGPLFDGTLKDGPSLQRLVYAQLGQMVRLETLVLGSEDRGRVGLYQSLRLDCRGRRRFFDVGYQYGCLDFSLKNGLALLGGLKEMKFLDVRRMAHRIGLEEVKWMCEHWPKLERIEGLFWTEEWEADEEMMEVLRRKGVKVDTSPWDEYRLPTFSEKFVEDW